MTHNTFKSHLEIKGHSNYGVEVHHRHLGYFLNWCEAENIESEQAMYSEMIGYIKHLQKRGVKQRTVQLYMNSLKHYFAWLIKTEVREENPTRNIVIKGIKRNYLYDIIKKPELETLYETFEIPSENDPNTCPERRRRENQNWFKASLLASKRNKVILGLMIWQGLGTGELGRLQIKDLKLRDGTIYISGSRKSNEREMKLESHQVLDLMEYTLQVRKELLEIHGKETDQLFISNGSGANKLNNAMQLLMKKLNKQNPRITSANQIRTSVITYWLKNYNLREVQYMAGHRYVGSTEAYLINDLDGLSEEIEKFHPM